MITKEESLSQNHDEESISSIYLPNKNKCSSQLGVLKRSSVRPSSSLKRSLFRVRSVSSRRKIVESLKKNFDSIS